MPLTDEIAGKYIVKPEKTIGFLDNEINLKARNDFCYLVKKSGLAYSNKLNHICISACGEHLVVDTIVLGADENTPIVCCPKSFLTTEEKAYISVVVYSNENVNGVYMFELSTIKNKAGMFSMFKDMKKQDCYGIKLNKISKCTNNKYGVVLSKYIK